MPTWLPRAIAIFLIGAASMWITLWVVVRMRSLLVMLVVALFASFALEPAVNWLAARGMRRGLATGAVMFGGLLMAVGFLVIIGQALVTQTSDFVEELPTYLGDVEEWVNESFDADVDFNELIDRIRERDDELQGLAADVAGNALDITFSAVGVVFQLFTVALFTFYMVADGPRFRRAVLQFLNPERQERVVRGWEVAIDKTGGYIYSRALLAVLSATFTSIFLAIMGVPYAIALGLFTGVVSQFVPTIGTYIGGALPVLIALSEDPVDAIAVLGFIVVYQQVENYIFSPKITAQTMDLHPAVAFGTVIAGASLFGGVGASAGAARGGGPTGRRIHVPPTSRGDRHSDDPGPAALAPARAAARGGATWGCCR